MFLKKSTKLWLYWAYFAKMSLFILVEDVMVSIFANWIEMKALGSFDTAVCNLNKRPQFLHLLCSTGAVFVGVGCKNILGSDYLSWLGIRKAIVSQVRVCDLTSTISELFHNDLIRFQKLKALKIEGVRFNTMLPIETVASECCVLEEFTLKAPLNNVDDVVTAFVKHCKALNTLTVDSWSHYSDFRNEFLYTKKIGDTRSLTTAGLLAALRFGANLTSLNLSNQDIVTLESSDLNSDYDYCGCSKLTQLDLGRCPKIADGAVRLILGQCSTLEVLDLHLCPLITDQGIEFVVSRNHNIRTINLACDMRLGDASLFAISKHCPHFEAANFNGLCITDESVIAIAQNCPKIVRLTLKLNPRITDASIEAIAKYVPDFQLIGLGSLSTGQVGEHNGIHIGFASQVTATSLDILINSCAKMHTFDLSNCSDIDGTVRLVAERCPLLKRLFISKSGNVSEETFLSVTKGRPELTYVEASGCVCLTDATLSSLAEHCPKLVWLDISSTKITIVGVLSIAKFAKVISILNVDWCDNLSASAIIEVTVQCVQLTKLHCSPVTNSSLILQSVMLNSPFMMFLCVTIDTSVPAPTFQRTVKDFRATFPRAHFTGLKPGQSGLAFA